MVAHIDRVREEAIDRIMRMFDMDRVDAERFVDRSEGRLFDLDDSFNLDEPFDVDISEQVTRMILPMDEPNDE